MRTPYIYMVIILVMLLQSCSTSKVNLKRLDQSNPKKVAIAVLKSYQNKDLASLQALATQQHEQTLQRLALSEDLTNKSGIFSGDTWNRIEQWNGKVTEVRFSDDLKTAFAMFEGNLEGAADSPIMIVRLIELDKQWYFNNIATYTKQSFDALGYRLEE